MRNRLLLGAALPLMILASAASAQEADTTEIDELVVTAKQRVQRLQDVPLAVTALDASTLEAARIEDIRDLSAFTPGLSFHSNSGRKDLSALAIRGLAPNTVAVQLQGVSSFYDGIYTGGAVNVIPYGAVQRIEVLKGPQSTTYGRSTYSGAIDYIVKTPKTDTISGEFEAEYSENRDAVSPNWDVGLDVALPIIKDRLWAGLYYQQRRDGALYKAPTTGVDIGREHTDSYGLTLYAEPTDNITLKVFGFYDKAEDSPPAIHMQHPQEWRAAGAQVGPSLTPGAVWLDDNVPDPIRGTTECISTRTYYLQECASLKDRYFLGAVATWNLAGYEVSYRGGYYYEESTNKYDTTSRGAAGGTDPFFGTSTAGILRKSTTGISQFDTLEGHSQQIRIVSPGARRLRWRAGAYYFYESSEGYSETYRNQVNVNGITNVKGNSGGGQDVQDIAAFGAIAYDLTDRLTVEVEGRLQEETVSLGACSVCSGTLLNPTKKEASTTDWMPRFTLSWKPTDDVMLYGLYSYGTKSGRFNVSTAVNFRFTEPEHLTNYEIGAKMAWFDRRLVLNGAAFIQKVEDQQFVARDPVNTSITYSQNIGQSDIWGFEAEGLWRITPALRLSGTLSYAHHEYASFAVPAVEATAVAELLNGQSLLGKTSVNVPRWNGSATLAYSTTVLGDRPLDLRADVLYRGESFADSANRATLQAVTRMNLKATLGWDQFSLSMFVHDVFDNKHPLGAASSPTSCVYGVGLPSNFITATAINSQRFLAVSVPRGREIGVSAAYRF